MRADVPHAGQKQGRQKVAIGESLLQLRDDELEAFFARRLLDEPHDRLDVRRQVHQLGRHLGLAAPRGDKALSKPELPVPNTNPAVADDFKNSRRLDMVPLLRERIGRRPHYTRGELREDPAIARGL